MLEHHIRLVAGATTAGIAGMPIQPVEPTSCRLPIAVCKEAGINTSNEIGRSDNISELIMYIQMGIQ